MKATADTSVNVYYLESDYKNGTPNEVINLKANEYKTTVIHRPYIWRPEITKYNPTDGKFISANTSITEVTIEGYVKDGHRLFDRATGLVKADLTKMNTRFMTSMFCMFQLCSNLTLVGDLSSWNTSKVTNMSYMFYGYTSLTSVGDLSSGIQAM